MSRTGAFTGSIVALVTPLKDGRPDLARIRELTALHGRSGTSALCPCGTTGEGATLTRDERRAVISACKEAAGSMKVIAGVGTNATAGTIENARAAADAGADGLLVVTPYYNKPTPAGMRRHFEAVAASVKLPIVLYNVPGRTSVNLEVETVVELARVPNIVAVKEASANLEQISRICAMADLDVLSGDDALTWPILELGGVGVISVAANIVPAVMSEMCRAGAARARELHVRYHNLFKALFIESNPGPIKAAMRHLKMIDSDELRLPLAPLTEANDRKLRDVLREYSLL